MEKMSDLIERQAALDAFGLSEKTRKYGGDHRGYDTRMLYEIQETLENLPSVQPEPHWISVSERLPDMPIRVLVQLDNGWIITAYRQDNEWFSVPDFGEAIKDKWVEAWMPLPEPYQEEIEIMTYPQVPSITPTVI